MTITTTELKDPDLRQIHTKYGGVKLRTISELISSIDPVFTLLKTHPIYQAYNLTCSALNIKKSKKDVPNTTMLHVITTFRKNTF